MRDASADFAALIELGSQTPFATLPVNGQVIAAPSGAPVAVFGLVDDGTYIVATGYDAAGDACALMVYVD